jgi:hypothetical protein
MARSVFHHFPITRSLVSVKCRQFSVLGFARGSLGSFYTAIVRRPLIISDCISLIDRLYSGLSASTSDVGTVRSEPLLS